MPSYLFRCDVCGSEAEIADRWGATPVCTGHASADPVGSPHRMRRVYSFGVGRVAGAGNSPARPSR